ncbi:hypothetical protein [Mesorhizobium sp.]|uniref:hypothetical protein n=1 Tax=Mesorhizobium sp. TaxID=1871066 RepID=UPI0025D68EE1|nr:hypothetical protein [Mesorhizobium sp.]
MAVEAALVGAVAVAGTVVIFVAAARTGLQAPMVWMGLPDQMAQLESPGRYELN